MTLGFLGLGKMGSRMVQKLAADGHEVHVWNRTVEVSRQLSAGGTGIIPSATISQLVSSLPAPRILWLMLPAGDPTEQVISELLPLFSPGDVLVEGGNSNFRDTERRADLCRGRQVRFLGIGVSGGIVAATSGYPLMAGGDTEAYELIRPILDSLAKPHGGHAFFGPGGAGHFVKMIHNGIEYGIMQSLGEGFGVLANAPYRLDLPAVAGLWQKGTLVSGFMLDRVVEAITPDPTLASVDGVIEGSGEADWTVTQAKEEGVPVPIIEQSLAFRKRTKEDAALAATFAARLVAALRGAFGGHDVKRK